MYENLCWISRAAREKRERERAHGGVYKSGKEAISVAVCVLVGLGGDWEQCEWSGG